MQDMPFDELKLRLSYGEVGNTAIDPYQTAGDCRSVYSWGGTNAYGFQLDAIANSTLGWEISKTIDFGFDYV